MEQNVNMNDYENDVNDDKRILNDFDYKFLDLFGIDEIQRLQDSFALATGVASK